MKGVNGNILRVDLTTGKLTFKRFRKTIIGSIWEAAD